MSTIRIPVIIISANEDFPFLDIRNKDSFIVDLHNKDSLINVLDTFDSVVPIILFAPRGPFDCPSWIFSVSRHPPGPCGCPCGWPGDGVDGWLV